MKLPKLVAVFRVGLEPTFAEVEAQCVIQLRYRNNCSDSFTTKHLAPLVKGTILASISLHKYHTPGTHPGLAL